MIDEEQIERMLRNTTTTSVPENIELLARLDTVSYLMASAIGSDRGDRLLVQLGKFVFAAPIREELLFGREEPSDLAIPLPKLSRQHFSITREEDGTLLLRDLESTNGTRVNGRSIQEHPLLNGDLVEAGGIQFAFIQQQPAGVDYDPEEEEAGSDPPPADADANA